MDMRIPSGNNPFNVSSVNVSSFVEINQTIPCPQIFVYLEYSVYLQSVITALIVILNAIVVYIIARRKKITRLYCYLLNLAIADLVIGLIEVLPRTLERSNKVRFLVDNPELQFPLCRIQRCLGHTALVTSNFILAAMSIDRAQVVVSPMRNFRRGRLIQIAIILFCWFVGLLCSIPITALHTVRNNRCEQYLNNHWWTWKIYYTYDLVIQFLLPLVIIVVSFSVLLAGIHQRGIMSLPREQSTESRAFNRRLPRSKLKSIKLTFGIIMSFLICWSPVKIFLGLQVFAEMRICYIVFITCLRYLNSIGNPICFFVFHYKKQQESGRHSPSTESFQIFLQSLREKLNWNGSGSTRSTGSWRMEKFIRPNSIVVNNKAGVEKDSKLSPVVTSMSNGSPRNDPEKVSFL